MNSSKTKMQRPQTASVARATSTSTPPPRASSRQSHRCRKTRLSTPVERPPVPAWMLDTPMYSKVPMMAAPAGKIMLYTTGLCEKLHVTPNGFGFDSSPQGLSMTYRSLHDPHLKSYYTTPRMYSHLMRSGFLTPCGMVKCSLREFNEYHQYVKQVHLEQLTQQRKYMMEKHRDRNLKVHDHHHKLSHKKRTAQSHQQVATASSKHHRRSPSTKSLPRSSTTHVKKGLVSKAQAKKGRITQTKKLGSSMLQVHHENEQHKHKKTRRSGEMQACDKQSLLLTKRFEEEMRREEKLERRKLIKMAERELKLQEQWDRREATREARLELEASQHEKEETEASKVKIMRSKMAEAHRARQEAIFASIRSARARLVAQREALIARRLEKKLGRIRQKYERRYRRQWAAFKHLAASTGSDKISDPELEMQKEDGMLHRGNVNAPAERSNRSVKQASSGLRSPELSSHDDTSSSSDEGIVFTPSKREKPVISITDEVLSVTSLDYRQSQVPDSQTEVEPEDTSMMRDVYLADGSGEEDGNLQGAGAVSPGIPAVSSIMAMADKMEMKERTDIDVAEACSSLTSENKDEDSSSSISKKISSGSSSSYSSPRDKASKDTPESSSSGKEPEDGGMKEEDSEDEVSVADSEATSQAKSEDAASEESDFWKSDSEASLHEGSVSSFIEEEEILEESKVDEVREEGIEEEEVEENDGKKVSEETSETGGKAVDVENLEIEQFEEKTSDTEQEVEEEEGEGEDEEEDLVQTVEENLGREQEVENDKLEVNQQVDKEGEQLEGVGEKMEILEDKEKRLETGEVITKEKLEEEGKVDEGVAEEDVMEEKVKTLEKVEGSTEEPAGDVEKQKQEQAEKEEAIAEDEIKIKETAGGKKQQDKQMDVAEETAGDGSFIRQASDVVASVLERSLYQLSALLITGYEEGGMEDGREVQGSQAASQDSKMDAQNGSQEGEQESGQTASNGTSQKKVEPEKLDSDSILLANVLEIFEEVEHEIHHHHHHHHSHPHEHHQHEPPEHKHPHPGEQPESEDEQQVTDGEILPDSGSDSDSSSGDSEEEGDIIGVVENEIIVVEGSITSLKGCLSGESVTGLTEVVKETEDHKIIFEGALMPLKHHSSTSTASSKVSINVTAAVLSAGSLKMDSSGRLKHDVGSQSHTKPELKVSKTNIPSDTEFDDHPSQPDEKAMAETSHHHYSNIVPIYHDNLINVGEELIDANLSAISMKPDCHHKVPPSYSTGSRNSFRNIFRPDMTHCQGSAKCLKDTLVQELSHSRHSKHSKHSSEEMSKYYDILEEEQEDVTAHHSEEELVTADDSEGVCYLPKRRAYKIPHDMGPAVPEQDEEVPEDTPALEVSQATEGNEKPKIKVSEEMKDPDAEINIQGDLLDEGGGVKDGKKIWIGGDENEQTACSDALGHAGETLTEDEQTSYDDSWVVVENIPLQKSEAEDNRDLGQERADLSAVAGCADVQADSVEMRLEPSEGHVSIVASHEVPTESHSEVGCLEVLGTASDIQRGNTPTHENHTEDSDIITNGPCEVNSPKGVDRQIPEGNAEKQDGVTDDEKHQYETCQTDDTPQIATPQYIACPNENHLIGNQTNENWQTENGRNENPPSENRTDIPNEMHQTFYHQIRGCPNEKPQDDAGGMEETSNELAMQELSVGKDDAANKQTEVEPEESSFTLSAASLSSSITLPISSGENPESASSNVFSDFDSEHPHIEQCLIPNTILDPMTDFAHTSAIRCPKDSETTHPEGSNKASDQGSPHNVTDSGQHSSHSNASDIPGVSSHSALSPSKSSSSRKSGSRLSAVIKKISSVFSVGRKRSSRVHPGGETEEAKDDHAHSHH